MSAGAASSSKGVLDTSTVISLGQITDAELLPAEPLITAVTLAELSVGPLAAGDERERSARQAHLQQAEADFDPLRLTPVPLARSARSPHRCHRNRSLDGERKQFQSFCACGGVKAAVPRREHEILAGQHESGSEMERIEAAQLAVESKRGGVLGELLVKLEDPERGPLVPDGLGRGETGDESDRADRLDEARPAHEPALGSLHRSMDVVGARLRDVALDQRTRVEVEVQRSASRSESTIADALRRALAGLGAWVGRAREGGTTRPWATSSRSRSSTAAAPAGTMSATGRPREVTRTCSPRPTARRVSLSERLSSRTPISRM